MGDTVAVFTQALFACLLASGWQATECPAASAIAAELQRLGTAAAVAGFGSPEVTVQGSRMRVALRAPDGTVSGVREVAAPASCLERAQVAAVLISAWIGAWHAGPFPDAARPPSSSTEGGGDAPPVSPTSSALPPAPATGAPTPLPSAARAPVTSLAPRPRPEPTVEAAGRPLAPRPAPAPGAAETPLPPRPVADTGTAAALVPRGSTRRGAVEVAGFVGGIHDGDVGALGGGVRGGYRFPGWLGIDAAFTANGERERGMAGDIPGTAAYRSYGFAIGVDVRRGLGPLLADVSLLPQVTLLGVDGRGLSPGRSATRWGAAIEARLGLGIALGAWRPFVFAGSSYALRGERLTVDGYADRGIALSRWNASYGLGLAYRFASSK